MLFALTIAVGVTAIYAKGNKHYITNRKPLVTQPYVQLPIGAIKPKGMMLEMLKRQRTGLTGNLDEVYEVVCGETNGWLGGEGDGWERGPYWIDGLLPLAYMLDDEELKAKAQKWVDWSLENQREDGYFGPRELPEDYKRIPGIQQGDRADWWPRMVMLKVLQQYYMATSDERVIDMMTKYFKYMLKELPTTPLNHWTYWGEQRGGDNLAVVYWLYNITGDKFLIELGDLIQKQTFSWTNVFNEGAIRQLNPLPDLHCVNVAQGIKTPVIQYQRTKDVEELNSVHKGLEDLRSIFGFVNGMYGGDEHLHGNNPTYGSELCSAVEMMFSFESILPVTGDVAYADYLEKIAYNVLPTQSNDDYTRKQYFQQANQISLTIDRRNFLNDNLGHIVYGVATGYPCCLTNMHQGWPKFVQNLWYATADNGVAALVYGESEVSIKVGDGSEVTIVEETKYPFSDKVRFTISCDESLEFPFHLRIPEWCKNPTITINGKEVKPAVEDNIAKLNYSWNSGDVVELSLPMEIKHSYWYNNSVGVERGPLVYALKIGEDWSEVKKDMPSDYWYKKDSYFEVRPTTPWNYTLLTKYLNPESYAIECEDDIALYPWNLENAPITLTTKAKEITYWTKEIAEAGYIPSMSAPRAPELWKVEEQTIELIPYGCTTLRISEFPLID